MRRTCPARDLRKARRVTDARRQADHVRSANTGQIVEDVVAGKGTASAASSQMLAGHRADQTARRQEPLHLMGPPPVGLTRALLEPAEAAV